MQKGVNGFTVIEVMIVMTITAVMFVIAILAFQGQEPKVRFSQGVRDIEARIKQYITEVHNGINLDSLKYNCTINASKRPKLSQPTLPSLPNGQGKNYDCIFLGKAFQVFPNTTDRDKIGVITVLGRRLNDSGVTVNSITEANPEPMFASDLDLTETYTNSYGIFIKSSQVNGSVANVAGFYNGIDQKLGSVEQAKAYYYSGTAKGPTATDLLRCIQENPPYTPGDCTGVGDLQEWDVCLTDGERTAYLKVFSTPAGIQTKIEVVSC